jgi:hypothetical protein
MQKVIGLIVNNFDSAKGERSARPLRLASA